MEFEEKWMEIIIVCKTISAMKYCYTSKQLARLTFYFH